MTAIALSCALLAALSVAGSPQSDLPPLRNGDVVLQTSRSEQSRAIQVATRSPYSHVGVVEVAEDGTFVIEAIGKVSRTRVDLWKKRGTGGRWTVLRHPKLTDEAAAKVVAEAKKLLGKPYDARFGWDDRRIYCSELVAKAYSRGAKLHVGRMQKVSELNILPILPAIVARYGMLPLDLKLISPASLAEDRSFEVVVSGFSRS